MTKNPILLTEYVRQAIRRLLVKPYLNQTGELPAFFVDTQMEQSMEGAIEYNEHVVSEAARRSLPISFLAAGREIPDDLEPAAKARLAELVRGENASPSTPRRVGAAA